MKKKFILIIVSILTLFSAFALSFNAKASATEKTEQEMVQEELNNIVLPEEVIFDFPVVYVSVYGSTIKWESNKPEVINVPTNGGWAKVNRQAQDEEVILTITLTKGAYSKSKDFKITVPKGQTLTSEYKLEFELNGGTLENAPTKYVVGSNLKLPTPTKGEVEFLGWYDNANFEGDSIESIPTGTFGDVKYYAKWAEAQIKGIQVVEYQKEYNAKQEFNKSSLKVVAVYNDNLTKEEISLDDLIVDKTILHYGDTKVVVSYGNYKAEVEVVVSQLEYELDFELEETYETTYNGKEQKLDLSSIQLPKGLSFVMESYKEANEAGYEVEVSLKNTDPDYKDVTTTYTTKFIIKKAELTVKFVCNDTFKAGQEIDLNNYVLYSGFVQGESKDILTGTLDFDITPDGYPAAGIYTVTPKGLTSNNYKINYVSGQLELTISSYQFKVENTETTYNGKNQMFTAKLLGDGQELDVEFTYTVKDTEEAFSGAINAGTYTVVVSYELEGETKEHEVTFIINAKKLEASMFDAIPEQNYTGQKVEPTVTSKDLELNKDFEILGYDNNIDKSTEQSLARVTVKGIGNYEGEIDLEFAIGETVLEEVRDAKEELDKEYGSSSALPEEDLVTETQNGSKVTWFSTSTALSIDKDGKVTTIQTDQEQVVVVYALITNGDSAEYAMYEFIVPAKSQTPDTYTVTLGFEAEQGEVKASKVSQITAGEKVTLTITPKEGYRVSSITVNGDAVSKDQREFTINENTTIQVSFELYLQKDETTGIIVENEDATLKVQEEENPNYQITDENGAEHEILASYDITFEGRDEADTSEVTIKIPLLDEWKNKELQVWHITNKETGAKEPVESTNDGEYITFTATSFSPYVVTVKKEEENPTAPQLLASFNLVEDETATGELEESSSVLKEFNVENNGYTLTFTELSKVYEAHDANGNGCLKLGTSSAAGSFLFSVESNITKVIIYIGYRTKPVNVSINGTVYNITSTTYTPIEIDTTSTKTIELVTSKPTNGDIRALVNTIEFYGGSSQGGQTPTPDPEPETTYSVTLNVGANGTASVSKQEEIKSGEQVTLTVTPNEGYKAVVKVDGVETEETTFTITKNTTIDVVFEKEQVTEPDPTPDTELTVEQAIALGASKEHNTYTSGKYYVEGVITEVYNTEYGNMKIKDANGNILTVYGTYSADGKTRYDELEVKPVAGDTVKVYGIIGQYNGNPQMKNGWVVEHIPVEQPGGGDVVDPNPDEGGTETPTPSGLLATFTLGTDTTTTHTDGKEATTYEETVNGYTLSITSGVKFYTGACDEKGNGCIKIGASSAIGSFTFTVSDEVKSVVIYVAKYKAKTSKISINSGEAQTLETSSNDGTYTEITIDTTTNKTISFATVGSTTGRVMINTIEFYGGSSSSTEDTTN